MPALFLNFPRLLRSLTCYPDSACVAPHKPTCLSGRLGLPPISECAVVGLFACLESDVGLWFPVRLSVPISTVGRSAVSLALELPVQSLGQALFFMMSTSVFSHCLCRSVSPISPTHMKFGTHIKNRNGTISCVFRAFDRLCVPGVEKRTVVSDVCGPPCSINFRRGRDVVIVTEIVHKSCKL